MKVTSVVPQLRTTDIEASIRFYTETLGFDLGFRYEDFYAGVRIGDFEIHLKLVDNEDPSVPFVREGGHLHFFILIDDPVSYAETLKSRGVALVREPFTTSYSIDEFIIEDNQGYRLHFAKAGGEPE